MDAKIAPFELEFEHGLADLTLGHFLRDVAERHGEREALVFGDERITYRALEERSRRLARALIGAGVGKGSRVAVLMGSRPEWIDTFFASALVGAVLIPVNTFAEASEREYILRHADAALLILQNELRSHTYLADLLGAHPSLGRGEPGRSRCPELPQLRRVVALSPAGGDGSVETLDQFLELGADVSDELLDAVSAEVTSVDDAIVIYTSGTTDKPKAVLHLQRAGVINGLRFRRWMELEAQDRVYTAQPFFWSAGIAMSLLATLDAGACIALEESFDPGSALELMERERVTTVHAWAHQHKAMGEHPEATQRDLSAIERIESSSPLIEIAGLPRTSWGLQWSYGMTESFTIFSILPRDSEAPSEADNAGAPLPGNRLRIVDPESGDELGVGEHGEIAIAGPTMMRGYFKVAPEVFLDASGSFRTGDGGYVDAEGALHWTGRLSTLIKTGGANVSPVEIEMVLRGYSPLKLALPVGVPHPSLGEAVVLCAVCREDVEPVTEDDVRSFCKGRLAVYKIPKRVLFFRSDELSYTSTDKVQVAPLRALALQKLASTAIDGHVYD
jgi:fatty-acyl-CoA synthase